MIHDSLPVLTVVVPFITALTIPILGRLHKALPWAMVCGALAFAAWASFTLLFRTADGEVVRYAMGGWAAPTGIEYVVDRLNAMVLVVVSGCGVLSAVWARQSVLKELPEATHTGFYTIFLLFASGLLGIVITGDVFNLYVFIEIASLTSYVLIALGRTREALFAGYTYLVIGSIGATFILLGIGHLYMATGTLAMSDLAVRVPPLYDSTVIRTAFAFFTVGLGIKMALFPLHGWQPAAYSRSPSAVSLFMSATATKVSAYAFYRIAFTIFGVRFFVDALPVVRDGIQVMAATAIVVGPLLAIRQTDLKRTFAFSSVGQIGYIMLAVVLLNPHGVTGGMLHFWNHAASKGTLFAVAGIVVYLTGGSRISDLAGMGRRAPWSAAALTVAACSMVGVPLTAGFVSKFYLAVGALEAGRWIVVGVLLMSSLLTAIYMWRILSEVWFAPDPPGGSRFEGDAPWSMRLPTLLLAALCLYLGVDSEFPVKVASEAAAILLR